MSVIEKLNTDEEKLIEKIQKRMKDALSPPMSEDSLMFYRFLKARDFDIDKAELMLRKHLVWRKAVQVDTILEHFKKKEVYDKYFETKCVGFDKDGDVVRYMASGKIDPNDLMKCMTINDYEKHLIYTAEESLLLIKEENEKTGRNCYQGSIIVNLDQISLSNVTSKKTADIYIRMTQLLQENYPEHLKSAYLINAPPYFVILSSILNAFMSTAMRKKFQIFGHNGWKEVLLEAIDAEVLPAFLGGKKTDPDGNPLCSTFISHGGQVPSKYHLRNEERWFPDKSLVKKLAIPAKGNSKVSVEVEDNPSLIQWKFEAKIKDIGFGLFLEEDENEIEILPIMRFTTSDGAEIGSYKTKKPGKYLIVFDNSYSRINSKEIRYYVTVSKCEP